MVWQGKHEVSVEEIAALCGVSEPSALDGHPDISEIIGEDVDEVNTESNDGRKANTGNVLLL